MEHEPMVHGFDHEMRIHFIRHAYSTSNAHGNIIGGVNADLAPRGIEEIAMLNRYLERYPLSFDAIYCSTMLRARRTIEGLRPGLSITDPSIERYDDRLREIDRGEWDGRPRDDIYDEYEKRKMALLDFDHSAPNGESMSDVAQRTRHWLYDATLEGKRRGWTSIVAVTHGIALKSLLQRLFHWDKKTAWQTHTWNTSITTVECLGDDRWKLIRLNAAPHLPPAW